MKDDQKTLGRPLSRRHFVKGAGAFVGAISLASPAHAIPTPPVQMPVDGEHKNRSPVFAMVQFEPGGRVTVASGSQDLGRGSWTTMAQTAATTLNLRIELIDVKLGDSTLPKGQVSGGSQYAASIGAAVHAAAEHARFKLLSAAVADKGSPLCGDQPEELDFRNCRIIRKGQPESGESFTAFLARNGNQPVAAIASTEPEQNTKQYSTHS
jgi:xanthine dehydrogenase YagR molybdenum-binding subunit